MKTCRDISTLDEMRVTNQNEGGKERKDKNRNKKILQDSMEISSESAMTTKCSHCERDIPASNFDLHYVHCSRNLERCTICGDMIPRRHAEEHYFNNHAPEVCGNRTEYCDLCSKYIRLRELNDHEIQFHGTGSSGVAESSSGESTSERVQDDRRRPMRGSPHKRLFWTIAITGFAILIGSFFMQRKTDTLQRQ
ncbi:hypothetical protein QJS04_geneDACA006480 [Acorus gramineus]|uniref:C2H2-type domain-containing protein n=1 Tax=Acorus gramineus TaxID=55184 RepID=A0AAV9AYG3_ACOGR|nr:hypothetical protein QJS04_geneDACA006480 [Acorus gramineus]